MKGIKLCIPNTLNLSNYTDIKAQSLQAGGVNEKSFTIPLTTYYAVV